MGTASVKSGIHCKSLRENPLESDKRNRAGTSSCKVYAKMNNLHNFLSSSSALGAVRPADSQGLQVCA